MLKDTFWIYINLLIAWISIMIGFYLLATLVNYMRQFGGSTLLNTLEVLITVLLFLLWLFLWRLLTTKFFKNVIGKI
ncbi:hypothetical protein KEJ27_07740 [Candidatus Bathyarchaeota archaeon]|nr:hypothetical protein [Candidatus Bathyarchaeota archaeon]MBS7613728.1 hypothetical protein [Candidatus Bathyarchaeota archaeon]MBS7618402.1 hypothetical protein [Candidatus Bathyarchaeota archaeon]